MPKNFFKKKMCITRIAHRTHTHSHAFSIWIRWQSVNTLAGSFCITTPLITLYILIVYCSLAFLYLFVAFSLLYVFVVVVVVVARRCA